MVRCPNAAGQKLQVRLVQVSSLPFPIKLLILIDLGSLTDLKFACGSTSLHPEAQLVVVRGVTDHGNGGRAIVMEALKAAMAPHRPPIIDVDSAATYLGLVHLFHVKNASWLTARRKLLDMIDHHPQRRRLRVALPFLLIGLAAILVFLIVSRITHYHG